MNILIDIGHPAHVHLFRNAAHIWQEHGHQILFTIRNRPLVPELLTVNNFRFVVASTPRTGGIGRAWELGEHDWNVLKEAIRFKADIMLGTSVSITHASKITRIPSIVFSEDDADYLNFFAKLAYPFANTIVIPENLRDKRTPKYVTYNSYHELAYLHPNHFSPDPKIFDELGIKPDERYFIVRLVSMKAHHDKGHKGISGTTRDNLISLLSKNGKVFITAEGQMPEAIKIYQLPTSPDRIHHVLYYAKMLVSDSQTMTMEAAVLGTPAIRYNTFVGLCSVIEELEHRYGLTYGFLPKDEEKMFAKVKELMDNPNLKEEWTERRSRMLADKIDLSAWMVDFVENYSLA